MSERNLRIQVLFAGLDRLSAPLRQLQAGSKGLAKSLGDTQRQIAGLKRAQIQIGQYKGAQERLSATQKELGAASTRYRELTQEIRTAKGDTTALARQQQAALNSVERLTASTGQQADRLGALKTKLHAAGVDVADLGRHEERLAHQMRDATRQADRQRQQLERIERVRRRGAGIQNAGNKIAGAGSSLTFGVTAPIVALGAASSSGFLAFKEQMASVSTLIDESRESMKAMESDILAIGKRTPVALADLAGALYDVRSAGIPAADAIHVLEGSARLGVAGLGTTAEAADLVTSSINAFGLKGRAAERVYDQIFKTVKAGKTTISQLAQGFGAVAGTVANANVQLPEYLASVAALTTTGLPAAQAHTQIRAAIAGLTRETSDSKKVFKALGATSFKDLVARSGGMVAAFARIRTHLKGNDAAMLKLFGSTEALNAVLGLTGKQAGAFKAALADMETGGNAVDPAFAKKAAADAAKLLVMKNRLQAAGIRIGAVVVPVLVRLGEWASRAAEAFDRLSPATRETLISAIALVAALGPLLFVIGKVTMASGFLIRTLGPLFIRMNDGKRVAGPLARAIAWLAKGLWGFAVRVVPMVGRALLMLGSAIARVGLMLLANPITWIVLAIVAAVALLAGAAYLIYRNWGPISAWFAGVWETIKAGVGAGWEWIKGAFNASLTWLQGLGSRFAALGRNLVEGLIRGILGALGWIKDTIVGVGSKVVGWFKSTLGINSPSRVFAGLGGHIMGGLEQGLDRGVDGPVARIRAAGAQLRKAMAASVLVAAPAVASASPAAATQAAAPARAATVNHFHLNISIQGGGDAKAQAREIYEEIKRLRRDEENRSFGDDDL